MPAQKKSLEPSAPPPPSPGIPTGEAPATALARYELSHPQIPQFRALLEAPQGYQPTARDFWEAVRAQVRPVGLSQLSDEAKLEAYQNGFFEDAPLQPGQPEPPSMTEGITDLFGKAYLATFSPNSPYRKLLRMGEPTFSPKDKWEESRVRTTHLVLGTKWANEALKREKISSSPGITPVPWRTEKNPDDPDYEFYNAKYQYQKQFAEAGKILFGLLSTHEDDDKIGDPIGIAIRRAKLPHEFEKDEVARGKAYAAALDYSTGNIEAATTEGLVRAMQGGPFVAAGAGLLYDKMFLSENPDDILDYVNQKIKFDKINHQYENAAEQAAFILENPQESLKGAVAGIVGGLTEAPSLIGLPPIVETEDLNELLIDKEDLTMESERMKDLQSGYMEPDPGVSFISEITYDPMNLAGTGVAKSLTAVQRASLAGRIKKTLLETQALAHTQQAMARAAQKLPASSPSQPLFRQSLESVTAQLAAKQEILDKYARNSFFLRMAGKSSPDELLKQSAKHLEGFQATGRAALGTTTDAARVVSGMVNDAATTSTKMGALRKALIKGAYFTPEVAGATIGGAMLGPLGAMAGAAMPSVLKAVRVLSTWPENVALRYIMRGATESGQEVSEAEAKRRWRSISRYMGLGTFAGLGTYIASSTEEGGQKDIAGNLGWLAAAVLSSRYLPVLSEFATAGVRDIRAIGPELVYARGSEDSPFFNRLSLLPSPGEGLIGATRERFNTLTASTGDRLRDKLLRPFEPIGTGFKLAAQAEIPSPGQFRPGLSGKSQPSNLLGRFGKMTGLQKAVDKMKAGGAPQLSDFSRATARFLDAKLPELGRTIEGIGRFGKMSAGGATIPATFGFLASGGEIEGAIAGALVSAPFTSVGAGFGMFENYRTKGDLYQRKIGDLQYYREHLSRDERVSFDALPLDARLAMSGYSLSNPDIIFEGVPHEKAQGRGSYSPSEKKIMYDQDTGAGIIEGVITHEIGHHIALHGLTPVINRIMFGNSETGEVGMYGKYDKDGKIEPNHEFLELKHFYLKRLHDSGNISPEDYKHYHEGEEGNRIIAEEIFADHVADYLRSGKRAKDNTWRGKIFDQAFEAMTGPSFLRDLILKLNVPMDSKGKFLEAGFFHMEGVKVERNAALQNLIKQYYRDTRGLRAREIEGEKVIDPATGRELKKLSKEGVRPMDDNIDQAFTLKDLEDPKLVQKLNTGGLFKYQVDKDGKPVLDEEGNVKLERDMLGNLKKFTAGELKKRSMIAGDHAAKVLEKYGVVIRYDKKGRPYTDDFANLDSRAIDELAKGPWHPKQIQTLREVSLALKEGDGERAGFLLGYFAASKNRKPGPVPFKIRTAVPYGFRLTTDGNILVVLHDVSQMHKNLEFLKGGHKKVPGASRKIYQDLFHSDDNQVWSAMAQYRKNTIDGRDGADGLAADPFEANQKKNFLNALHGAINDEHVQLNPILRGIDELTPGLPGENKARKPFGAATKTFRLDRIFSTERSGTQIGPVNPTRAKLLLMPGGRPKKPGREKRVTGRFSDDLVSRVKAVAAEKGISQNDALIELIEQGLEVPGDVTPEQAQPTPPAEPTPPVESVDPSPNVLTQAEQGILQNPNSSAEYLAAKKKQDQIELNEVEDNILVKGTKKVLHFLMKRDDGRRFMPSVDQRKATKYGQVFKQAGLNDIELAKAARTKWKEMGDSSPFLQTFLNGETADPPMFAQMKNGEWKPTNLYHVGTLGVAAGKSRNPLEILNDSPTVRNSEVWAPESTTILTLDRKRAYDLQRAEDPGQKPLQVITNAKYVFDIKNPEHTKTLDEQLAVTARDEGGDPAHQEFTPGDSSSLFAYETELKKLGWHGYRFEEGGVEKIAIFDSKRIKLNEDHRGDVKLYSKDRDFGKVSGLFGHRLATDRFSANPQAAKDIRFMPQMEFDFTPPKSKKPKGETRPNWWQVYKIDPKAPDVYDRVADEIIWRGSPEHDGAIVEQYSTFLNLDAKKLRAAMPRAHRRWEGGDRRFMPAQDERLQELKEQLEMLGPDPMYRDYPELAKAIENVENFLTPDERVEYVGLKLLDRQARQAFERTFGVDPVIKPASARTLARQAGQYEIYDQWKRIVFDPLLAMEDVSVARRKFRTGEAGKQFMPAAYHGTPHTFKAEEGAPLGKFKSAQIGTGEGALAFGHGLYFAGNKEVAAYYREQLAPAITKNFKLGTMDIFKNEVPLDYSPDKLRRVYDDEAIPRASLVEDLMIDEGTIRRAFLTDGEEGAKKAVKKVIEDFIDVYEGEADYIKVGKKALKMPIKFEVSEPGSLYKVELAPKENEYLLWDKPFSKQNKKIRDVLSSLGYSADWLPGSGPIRAVRKFPMADIYYDLAEKLGSPQAASAALKEAGIPGIKYLDGSSRAKGKGDYNYVIFDEGDVAITEKMFMPAAYHGTPHTFKAEEGAPLGKFKTSQIGTGEGGQAFGHGLYFASKKEVAEYYRNDLYKGYNEKTPNIITYEIGLLLDFATDDGRVLDAKTIISKIKSHAESLKEKDASWAKAELKTAEKTLRLIEKGDITLGDKGSLYKVELAPKEDEYLLFDKPLSEQSAKVKKALAPLGYKKDVPPVAGAVDPPPPGGRIYFDLSRRLGEGKLNNPAASAALKEAGIPGIKYLDGLSREVQQGTYDYVIFDEADVTITEKMFMPASEAGAPKGKLAEAAKLWNKDGVKSPYFKKWFGKSKVVDENGDPLVVYHGTRAKFDSFDISRSGESQSFKGGKVMPGISVAYNKGAASIYGPNVLDAYVKSDKILDLTSLGYDSKKPIWDKLREKGVKTKLTKSIKAYAGQDYIPRIYEYLDAGGEALVKAIKKAGYDSVKYQEPASGTTLHIFSPEQIKSATGNRGTFDAGEGNINYMPSDPKAPKRQPVNRVQPQAQSMPANRFMAPAASAAKGELGERFR